VVPTSLEVEFSLTPADRLSVNWVTNIGTTGTAIALRSKAAADSRIQPRKVDDWKSFKEVVSTIENNRFIFRGQKSNKWRLRTGYHRSGRANLNRFEVSDIRQLHRHLSGLTRHIFNLQDPMQNLAFINLVQHHGYPTPLLDWTHSPYVAAFFAFRDLNPEESCSQDGKVRIFKLDAREWYKLTGNINVLYPCRPSLTIADAIPF
jgi:FRG domain